MIGFIKRLWRKISRSFSRFIKAVFNSALKKFIAELKDFAIGQVKTLATTDLSSFDKRNFAFDVIKKEAIDRVEYYKTSWIYILIELAYQYYKNVYEKEPESVWKK